MTRQPQIAARFNPRYKTAIPATSIQSLSSRATIGTAAVTINHAGKFTVTDQVNFIPSQPNVVGIKITTSNVELDLNDRALFQTSPALSFTALEIADNVSNVTIQNGQINHVTGTGILVGAHCSNIKLKNLSLNACTGTSIQFNASNNCLIKDCQITNTGHNDEQLAIGLTLTNCDNVAVINGLFNHSNGPSFGCGLQLHNCIDCRLLNCEANGNQGIQAYGFNCQNCTTCLFTNCRANNNTARTNHTTIATISTAAGFNLYQSQATQCRQCQAQANQSPQHCYGFKLTTCQSTLIKASHAIYNFSNSTTGHGAWGFYSTHPLASHNVFCNCTANYNCGGTNAESSGCGFELAEHESFATIANCIASGNCGGDGVGYGFRLHGAQHCTIKQNRAEMNSSRHGKQTGFGFQDTSASSVNLYIANFAFANGSSDGEIINNYDVALAPDNDKTAFPSIITYLHNFNNLIQVPPGQYNIEVIEKI